MSGDADYASVSLLLHCDGADGSTTFVDNSPTPKTITVYGNAHIETDQSKFGGASAAFDGTGDYLTFAQTTDLSFDAGDMAIELWFRSTQTTAYATLLASYWGGGGFSIMLNGATAALTIYWSRWSEAAPFLSGAATTHTDGNWHHLAWTKQGEVHRLFLDGVQQATRTVATTFATGTNLWALGTDLVFGGRGYLGYLDDIRITKGVARYTANFTPPTEAFPNNVGPTAGDLALTAYPPYLPGQIEAVMFGLQAFGLQAAPILAPTTDLALGAYPVLLDNALAPAAVLVTAPALAALGAYPVLLDGVLLPAAIELRHLLLTPWVMPMTSPVYPPAVEVTLLPPPPGVSIRGLWSPGDALFGWSFNSGTDTISFPLASLFELTAAQADPVTGDWRAVLLALVNSLWDAYIELDTPPQAMVLEYNPGYVMTVGPMINTVRAEYGATTYLTFPDKFIADEP